MFVPRVTSVPLVGDMMKAFWARAALGRREARRVSVSVVNFIVCGWFGVCWVVSYSRENEKEWIYMRKSRRASSVVHCLQLLPLIDGRCAGCDGRDAEDDSFLRTSAPRQLWLVSLLCYCMLRSANSLLHCSARRECTSLCSACFAASSVCMCAFDRVMDACW